MRNYFRMPKNRQANDGHLEEDEPDRKATLGWDRSGNETGGEIHVQIL